MTDGNIFAKAAEAREKEQEKIEEKVKKTNTPRKIASKPRKTTTKKKPDGSTPATVLVSLSLEDKKKLKFAAIERDMSVSALIREFIATL